MKLKILLINPWIYDFAAYNLWSRPLGLLKVAEYLSAYDVDLKLIDCTDTFAQGKYGTGKFSYEEVEKPECLRDIPRSYKRYGISVDDFIQKAMNAFPFDVVIVTSIMSYWYPGVQKAVETVRRLAGNVPVILGGIYASLYNEHAAKNSGADFIYQGQLTQSFNFALYTFGFKLKKKREQLPYYRLNIYKQYPFAPLLTANGCPFRCSYCASNLLSGKYQMHSVESVLKDITGLYCMGVKDFAFYDDALLVDADNHIKPILKGIIKSGIDVRLHTPNGLHARFLDEELALLMKKAGFKTIRLSLESIDAKRQGKTGGKVNNEDLIKAVKCLKDEGFTKQNIGVYLMYGLPGQELGELREGVEFLKSLDVRINLTEFSPIKGTVAWDELVKSGIMCDDIDPLLTNNTVFSYLYCRYDSEELENIKLSVKAYNSI